MEPEENIRSAFIPGEYSAQTIAMQTQDNLKSSNLTSVSDRPKYKLLNTGEFRIDIHNDLLNAIRGNTWNLYKVTHLYNLNFTLAKFKECVDRINLELLNNLNDVNDDVFDIRVFKIPILNNNDECFGLKFEVFLTAKTKLRILKFQSILFSWGEYTIEDNICHLPFMMSMGDIIITRLVNTAICELFDTTIKIFQIPQIDALWLSTMVNNAANNDDVYFKYKMNNSRLKKMFSVRFPNNLIKKLWNEILAPDAKEVSFQQVQTFYQKVLSHLLTTYGMNFEFYNLHQISVGNATIYCEGKIKISSNDAIVKILTFINEIA